MGSDEKQSSGPVMPRRAFVAAGCSAVLAGAAVSLGVLGGATRPKQDVFQFSRGLAFAAGEEDRLRGHLAGALADDRMHVTIVGHTGDAGDGAANQKLSDDRAAAVKAMAEAMGVSAERITFQGVGGAATLPKEEGESARAYQSRLARVEVTLQMRR